MDAGRIPDGHVTTNNSFVFSLTNLLLAINFSCWKEARMEECLCALVIDVLYRHSPLYSQFKFLSVPVSMGARQHLVLAAALSAAQITLSLPQNYDDIDMSIDQPKNEKVDIR